MLAVRQKFIMFNMIPDVATYNMLKIFTENGRNADGSVVVYFISWSSLIDGRDHCLFPYSCMYVFWGWLILGLGKIHACTVGSCKNPWHPCDLS